MQGGESSLLGSGEYILSTSASNFLTASTRPLSAGPCWRTRGLIIEGFIGRVEFGSNAGSQFPAGRSYHGVEGSPCMAGMTHGAVFAALATGSVEVSASLSFLLSSLEDGPSSTAVRSCWIKLEEKYLFSSQRPIKSCNFLMCFGQLLKDAALRTRAGRVGSNFWANSLSRSR